MNYLLNHLSRHEGFQLNFGFPICSSQSTLPLSSLLNEQFRILQVYQPTIANCKFDKKRMVAPLLDSQLELGQNFALGEARTAKLLQEGPLATGINARGRSIQFYSKGTHLTKALLT